MFGISFHDIGEATTLYIIVHGNVRLLKWFLSRTDRHQIIVQHFEQRALGLGHQPADVLACEQDNCKVL